MARRAAAAKPKMDTPHAARAMKLERSEGFRDRSVARETCLELASVLQGARLCQINVAKNASRGRAGAAERLGAWTVVRAFVWRAADNKRNQ